MINLNNIWTVAVYERKTLFRSWFFRIFSILTLLILFSMNMGVFAEPGARWTPRAIPANIPYLNVLFVNVAQAVIAVFLASDFLRRDKKLDTTEVIYARPISNGEYVTGKTLGIMILFTGLVVAILLMALVFNLILKDTPVEWMAYLLYPLLISIPTLTFILGLSFFLMILLRSQAVTFIVLLGYIGLTLFYFKDKLNGLLDYMGFYYPMVYSDLIGFADQNSILLQRGAYFLLGIACIFATIRFLSRLPQTGRWNMVNLFAFLLFAAAGGSLGYMFHNQHRTHDQDRREFVQINNAWAHFPLADVLSNDLAVEQKGRRILVTSTVMLANRNEEQLDTLVFSLNPGFRVDSITGRQGAVEFEKHRQLLLVQPEGGLAPGGRMVLTLYSRGIPDPDIAYLDVPEKKRSSLKRIILATVDKLPGIMDPEYILLTREMLWYPLAGVGFNKVTYQPAVQDFSRFTLSVTPGRGLIPVAPGQVEEDGEGTYRFRPEQPLSALPLVIGPFVKMSRTVDEVEYHIYLKEKHDFFSGFFPNLSDTLDVLLKEAKDDYEYDELDLYYPFRRMNLVETPVQFHPYERPYSQYVEMVQPEMIFMPERGAGLSTLDFNRLKRGEARRNRERNNSRSEEEMETDLFRHFITNTFFDTGTRVGGGFRSRGEDLINYSVGNLYSTNPYSAFPLYYNLVAGIRSDEYPAFNAMIETYLKEGYEISPRESFRGGISDSERANLALRDEGLLEIFARKNQDLIANAIYQSGSFIINALHNRVGRSEFDSFLYYYLEDHAFTDITFSQFENDFRDAFDVEISPYMDFLTSGTELPEFLVSAPEYIQTRDEYGDVYVVRMKISNTGGSSGLIDLTFRMPGQGGFGPGGMDTEQRLYEIGAGRTKDVQLVFYSAPRVLTVNTLLSGNIPSSFSIFLRSATEKSVANLEEYARDAETAVNMYTEGEIVVDNEDRGFSFVSVSNESKVKKFIDSRKEENDRINYHTMNPWWTPATWTPVAHSAMFGQTIRSALVVRSGDGSNTARWHTMMEQAGFYEVHVYIPVSAMLGGSSGRGRGEGRGMGGGGRPGGPEFADRGTVYHYTVASNEGTEEVEFALDRPEDGWNLLGTFHFPADTAEVTLTNNTNGSRVVADAVKWVPKE
ncbi:MAG: ABC transporter permease subunit [Bacteroidales bacterium]|nr:ABC transporter permease subunit [Bacteroidales bacterium]